MKRGIMTIVLLILLVTPLILAENTTQEIKDRASAIMGGIDTETENILEREVNLPQILKTPLRIILGIEDGATWQQLIVVLGVFIGFFILIFSIVDFVPFFKEGTIKILSSLIITTIVSITGALDTVTTFFFDVAGFFKWTASWGPLQMIVAILIAGLTILVFNKIASIIKRKVKIEKAEELGEKIKEGSKSAEVFSEGVKEFSYSHKMRRGGEKSTRGRFVSRKATERYSKMFGDEQAKKRFT